MGYKQLTMGIEQHRDRVISRIKQAISQSGINLSAIPADQQERLVNTIGDSMLFELDAILDGMGAATSKRAKIMRLPIKRDFALGT